MSDLNERALTLDKARSIDLTQDTGSPELVHVDHTGSDTERSHRTELDTPSLLSDDAEMAITRNANNDDGDISLVGSPKITESTSNASVSSHRRIDSVPPQKYSVTHDGATGLSSSLASASLYSTAEEDEEDITVTHPRDSADLEDIDSSSSAPHSYSQSRDATAIDKADLNFVDIVLDAPEPKAALGGQLNESSTALAGSAKTAEQIRNDNLSSQDLQASTSTPRAADTEHEVICTTSSRLSAHEQSPPPSPDQSGTEDRRSAEGRYRGRRSATCSRAASPTRSLSRSTSRRISMAVPQEPASPCNAHPSAQPDRRSAPVLLAADEHGNISVVSDIPVSPRTVPTRLPLQDEQEGTQISARAHGDTAAQESRGPRSDVKVTSLSDEIEAAEAGEPSKTCSSAEIQPAASSLTPPDAGGAESGSTARLSDKADERTSKNRRKSSWAGTNCVESRTRMTTLPAKTKTEEIKHRTDFERMMMAAKEVERRKRDEEQERKRRRQDEQREALTRWEKEILPSWSRARGDAQLEQLWWKGAPPSIRGRVWALVIGNPLMLPRNLLEQHEKRAAGKDNKSIDETIPRRVLDQIDEDIEETLPSCKLFQANGPLHDDLVRLCRAFVLVRIEQVAELDVAGDANKAASHHQSASPALHTLALASMDHLSVQVEPQDEYARRGIDIYQPGLASLAAVLLINMSINTAFIALLNLIHSKSWLKALYSLLPTCLARTRTSADDAPPKHKAIRGFERVFETLLADQMPKVFANLLANNVKLHRVVLREWVSTLWTRWLDMDTVMRLWDVVLLDQTDAMIYRVCLGLVQILESRLYVPDQHELESVLSGTNRAALAIWRRDKQMSGHQLSISPPTSQVDTTSSSSSSLHPRPSDITPRDYIYEQYGIQEHHIFETLEAQQNWWKPSTLQRLLDRELSE